MRSFLICTIVGVTLFSFAGFAYAREPLFFSSWSPQNYAPSWFEGKRLPVNETPIRLSFELVSRNPGDEGKIVDISGREVRWYVNDEFYTKGNGLQTVIIKAPKYGREDIDIKISAVFYDSETGETYLTNHYFSIPLSSPRLILSSPLFPSTTLAGASFVVDAFPFFFNTMLGGLDISWLVNNIKPTESGDSFSLKALIPGSVPSGGVRVDATVKGGGQQASSSFVTR